MKRFWKGNRPEVLRGCARDLPWSLSSDEVYALAKEGQPWCGHLGFALGEVHGGVDPEMEPREAARLGFAVQVMNVEEGVPALKGWMEAPRGIEAHVGERGSGLFWHSDLCPFLAVQLSGRKRWDLARIRTPGAPDRNLTRVDPPSEFESVDLDSGDALYVPSHFAHRTEALSESLSLSLAFEPGV